MRISTDNNMRNGVSFYTTKKVRYNNLSEIKLMNKVSEDTFSKQINFRGAPWSLYPPNWGVPLFGEIKASDAIKLYDKLSCGNYLDIGDDRNDFYRCNQIRENNLEFLDRVISPKEQREFIEYYKDVTGFPNLSKVSEKIKKAFTDAVSKSSKELYYDKYKVEQAGYDGVCSVGRGKALPGSDIDKAYIILKGDGTDSGDTNVVDNFRGKLWHNTDQRILSYNHDEAAFPQVYTERQVRKLAEKAKISKIPIIWIPGFIIPSIIARKISKLPITQQEKVMSKYTEDYINANPYMIALCDKFPMTKRNNLDVNNPTKENIKNIGFVMEAMREGHIFEQFGKIKDSSITDSEIYKYSNLSQLQALKQRGDKKPKRLARERLMFDFPKWGISKQFRFVKTLIESACANNRNFTTEFSEYFSKSGQDLFAPLISRLIKV